MLCNDHWRPCEMVPRQVNFVDWGNGEVVAGNKVRAIDVALKALEPQAHFYALAHLKVSAVQSLHQALPP